MLVDLLLHELLHVIGIGTVWKQFSCVGSCSPGQLLPVYYGCSSAQVQYNALGFSGLLPIENVAGAGSSCVHWSEATLGRELMTPVFNYGKNYLSKITIGSLADLGYAVDYSKADAYSVLLSNGAEAESTQNDPVVYFPPVNMTLIENAVIVPYPVDV